MKPEKVFYGEYENQYLLVYLPDADKFPVVVCLHGGGFEDGNPDHKFIRGLVEKKACHN